MVELLQIWLAKLLPEQAESSWLILCVLVSGLAVVLDVVLRAVFSRLIKQTTKTRMLWDDLVLHAINAPLLGYIWLLAGFALLQILQQHFDIEVLADDNPLPKLSFIIIGAWACLRFLRRMEEVLVEPGMVSKPMDPTTVSALGRVFRIIIGIILLLIVMQSYGYSISGILAFGGIGGIAVGFAAKDLLANFFGGMMIYLDRPFKVGDWIRSPDKNIEGVVEEIGWRQTRIRTFDKRPLYVPNSTFNSISVENPSRMTNRRIYEYVGVRYDDADQVLGIVDAVKAMLAEHEAIDHNLILMVNLDRFGPSSLDFFIYTFTKTTDWATFHAIKQDVMVKVMAIIEQHNAEIAFPTTTLHLASMPEPTEAPA
ncbi:mechanosensitive ion channel family protein [Pontibacter sp. JAM-7]|uniref:mechanosensitive ion channel family protein n=1 Tax=Pontibacter sp. JAM-7 TaxID=3366581 RepID=UPI003AF9BF04